MFLSLMDSTPIFRAYVFRAFANRMQSTMHVLEKVAFQRVEARLAEALLTLAKDDMVTATQAELASHIGSAREVVSRQLDSFAKRGWVARERGKIMLKNRGALAQIAEIV
jgi:CRP/FNR family transcriptional regulator